MNRIWGYVGLLLMVCAPAFGQTEAEMRQAAAAGVRRGPIGRPTEAETRPEFIEIEKIARLAPDQRQTHIEKLYSDLNTTLATSRAEMAASTSPPARLLLDRQSQIGLPRDSRPEAWGQELDEAIHRLSPEQVADTIIANHGTVVLLTATRRRAIYVLLAHKPQLIALIEKDIATNNPTTAARAFSAISTLRLGEMTEHCIQIYLADGPLANQAQRALTWIPFDQNLAKLLVNDVENNPASLKRHSTLIAIFLRDQPVDQRLLKYLRSEDPDTRYAAASAILETNDNMVLALIPSLLDDPDPRIQQVGARITLSAPSQRFAIVRPMLVRLLSSPDIRTQIDAAYILAGQRDPVAAPVLLTFLKKADLEPGLQNRVRSAIRSLLGAGVRFNAQSWGSDAPVISQLEEWIKTHPAGVQ